MDKTKKLSNSVRKYIRGEKARIRRQIFDVKKQNLEIEELYKKINGAVVAEDKPVQPEKKAAKGKKSKAKSK